MPKRKRVAGRAGKVFLNIEMSPELRQEMRIAAMQEGMHLKDWLPVIIRKHLAGANAKGSLSAN